MVTKLIELLVLGVQESWAPKQTQVCSPGSKILGSET